MMFHNHRSLIRLKEMLKGLKKTKANNDELEVNPVRPTINENKLKKDAVMEEDSHELNYHQRIEQQEKHQELQKYRECYDLFLQGRTQILQEKLENLKLEVSQQKEVQSKIISKGKFDYTLDLGEEKGDPFKSQLKKRNLPIMASNRIKQYCIFCPDNEELELLSASNYVYLALPKHRTFKTYFHLILAPVDHEQTQIGLNEDTLTQINNYKKCLIQAFDKIDLQVIFFQQFYKNNSHIFIQCLPMPIAKAQDLPFFFKQALEDVQGSWSTHKNIIKIEKDKGGLQKQIPKQIKYFYIDFSNGYGYAHVIENQKFWKRQFCYQILATALGLETHNVKTTEELGEEQKVTKRQNFNKIWKNYDWTKLI